MRNVSAKRMFSKALDVTLARRDILTSRNQTRMDACNVSVSEKQAFAHQIQI